MSVKSLKIAIKLIARGERLIITSIGDAKIDLKLSFILAFYAIILLIIIAYRVIGGLISQIGALLTVIFLITIIGLSFFFLIGECLLFLL